MVVQVAVTHPLLCTVGSIPTCSTSHIGTLKDALIQSQGGWVMARFLTI